MKKQLPKNWVETELGNYAMLKNGYAFKSNDFQTEGLPVVKISNIKDFKIEIENSICVDESKLKPDFIIAKGDILIAMSGATTGKYGVFEQDVIALQNQRVGNLKPVVESLSNRRFLLYLLGSLKEEIEEKAYGAAQPNISPKLIESINIFLPPLAEQNRIVEKLDRLFAQLEIIKSSMVKVPELLKDFRQQVLTQAVTGKLTEEWRKGKKLEIVDVNTELNSNYFLHSIPEKWKHSVVGNIGKVKGGKRLPKGHELVTENTGLPYIRARDLKKGTVLTDKLMFLKPETQIQIKNYIVNKGDLYITIVGAKIGDAGVVPAKMHAANLTENAAKITDLNEFVFNEYISIWLRGTICQSNIQETIMSAAQGKLALTRISQLPIYLPPLQEQQEIVSRVESLFARADAIEQQYKTLKTSIDTLPQALLHKAFKGELTEQLDSDGDAKELLEEIKALKDATGKVIKSKTNKRATKKVKPYSETEEVMGMVAEEQYKK